MSQSGSKWAKRCSPRYAGLPLPRTRLTQVAAQLRKEHQLPLTYIALDWHEMDKQLGHDGIVEVGTAAVCLCNHAGLAGQEW